MAYLADWLRSACLRCRCATSFGRPVSVSINAMKNKALILAGDHWHDPQICFDSLGQDLAAEGVEAETTRDYEAFGRYMLRDKQLFILHRDGVEFPKAKTSPPNPGCDSTRRK